jgi:hypothetical protein
LDTYIVGISLLSPECPDKLFIVVAGLAILLPSRTAGVKEISNDF